MKKIDLAGKWQMREVSGGQWLPVSIPGSVISGLLENQKIANPYDRMNEYEIREMMRGDYVFEKTFELPRDLLTSNCLELVCEGLDTIAEIYLNGQFLGCADNMHRTWRYDCSAKAEEKNILQIIFKSPINYIESYKETPGDEITNVAAGAMKGNQYIRKAHSMFGWDWGAQLPDMGIWRNIRIEAFENFRLGSTVFTQEHKPGKVVLKTDTYLCSPVSEQMIYDKDKTASKIKETDFIGPGEGSIILTLYDDKMEKLDTSVIPASTAHAVFEIDSPKLWWPNGLGRQPLYTVKVELTDKDYTKIEEKIYKIGLRTLTVSREEDEWGKEFAFKVNGVKIFTKGANYIPEDCIYSWITKDRMKMLVETAVRSNFNCLRVWGGGYYPSDEFYDLCDENGLIVWQDLMYACNVYDFNEAFENNIIEETKDNVSRLRHHACLGLWCGNNEIESAWHHWPDFQTHSMKLRADYIKQFEYCLPKTVKACDHTTFYWPSSPSSGGCFEDPDNENNGDTHYWDVWHGQKSFSDYHNHYFRFCSEFGFQSFPCYKTVKSYTEDGDRNIFSEVMESHQKNQSANGKMLYYLSENFQYPKDFESLLYVSQILQGMAVRHGVEHWRRNRGRCMGSLYWQLNDNWPVASWSSIDYFGRWKALQYMAGKFYAQKLGSIYEKDGKIYVYAVNDDLEDTSVKVTLRLKNMMLEVIEADECISELGACSSKCLMEKDYSKAIEGRKNDCFAEAVFEFGDGTVMTQTEVFVPYKYVHLAKPSISVKVSETESGFKIRLKTNTFTPFVCLETEKSDVIFSGNYFCMGSEDAEVTINAEDIYENISDIDYTECRMARKQGHLTARELESQLKIKHLYDAVN